MEQTSVICEQACTITHVFELSFPPFQLSPAEGALIASAILAVWSLGFVFRALIRTINSDSVSTEKD